MKYRLILASASPRRKELLEQIGAEFEVVPAAGEEKITSTEPEQIVLELSRQKALEVAGKIFPPGTCVPQEKQKILSGLEGHLGLKASEEGNAEPKPSGLEGRPGLKASEGIVVLGADTLVAFQGRVLGKPKGEEDAVRMLKMLSGNTHSVFTGVSMIVLHKNKEIEEFSFFEETKVTMYPMTKRQIQAYVKTGEPMDKAGAYGIQGKCAIYIEKIAGDYNNVVGLPVAAIYQKMEKSGIEIL